MSSPVKLCSFVAMTFAAAGVTALVIDEGQATNIAGPGFTLAQANSEPEFSEIVSFVKAQGWIVHWAPMCVALQIEQRDCRFRQLFFSEGDGRHYGYGLNVPEEIADPPYVLVFHLKPLVGEFFVVSLEGKLIRAYYRSRGTDYTQVPNAEAKEEAARDIEYWKKNLGNVRHQFPNRAPPTEK